MQIDDTHAFSGPKFIVFPQPKREHIRQTLLAATKVPRYGPDFYNFYGLKWSHEIGGKGSRDEAHAVAHGRGKAQPQASRRAGGAC